MLLVLVLLVLLVGGLLVLLLGMCCLLLLLLVLLLWGPVSRRCLRQALLLVQGCPTPPGQVQLQPRWMTAAPA